MMEYFKLIYKEELISFAISCSIISLICMLIDFMIHKTQKKESILGIVYKSSNFFIITISWLLGAFGVGYIVSLLGILQVSQQSVVMIGLLWPYAFTKIVSNLKDQIGLEDEEEDPSEEE